MPSREALGRFGVHSGERLSREALGRFGYLPDWVGSGLGMVAREALGPLLARRRGRKGTQGDAVATKVDRKRVVRGP